MKQQSICQTGMSYWCHIDAITDELLVLADRLIFEHVVFVQIQPEVAAMKHLNQLITALFFLLSYSVASFAGGSLNIFESKGMNKMGGMTEEQKDLYRWTFHDYMLLMKDPAHKEHLKKQQLDQQNAQHDHDGASPDNQDEVSPSEEKKSSCFS